MRFWCLARRQRPRATSPAGLYLAADGWNDYGYVTLWTLHLVAGQQVHEIGGVKIGNEEGSKNPDLPQQFTELPPDFFSLGQDENYYENLNRLLDSDAREQVLRSLGDLALDLARFEQLEEFDVVQTSLLRWVKPVVVTTQFHRMAVGGRKRSPYTFTYTSPPHDRLGFEVEPCRLEFKVEPEELPKSNVHVLIGSNGVGKSFMLHDITVGLTDASRAAGKLAFEQTGDRKLANRFANVVSVAFSAFDEFEPVESGEAEGSETVDGEPVTYTYIGLKRLASSNSTDRPGVTKSPGELADEFVESLAACRESGRERRWLDMLGLLDGDPLFGDLVHSFSNAEYPPGDSDRGAIGSEKNANEHAFRTFMDLSSGHKIVLLTLTKLVETVEEATLVVIDEPESHLHPPLLSAFMTALTTLLEDRNAAAIVVTHSPVVVQEVPSNCVYILLSLAGQLEARRPALETYGENVGTLTQEIFGLQVSAAGFHRTLSGMVADGGGVSEIERRFEGRLGAEARAILEAMVYFARN